MIYKKKAKCAKCGGSDIAAEYCAVCYDSNFQHADEAIHRYCRNCGYRWSEAPLDTRKRKTARLQCAAK